jgi:hypothetical protein
MMNSLGMFGGRSLLAASRRTFFNVPMRAFASKPSSGKDEHAAEAHGAGDHAPFNWGEDSSYVPGREYLRETGERADRGIFQFFIIFTSP